MSKFSEETKLPQLPRPIVAYIELMANMPLASKEQVDRMCDALTSNASICWKSTRFQHAKGARLDCSRYCKDNGLLALKGFALWADTIEYRSQSEQTTNAVFAKDYPCFIYSIQFRNNSGTRTWSTGKMFSNDTVSSEASIRVLLRLRYQSSPVPKIGTTGTLDFNGTFIRNMQLVKGTATEFALVKVFK